MVAFSLNISSELHQRQYRWIMPCHGGNSILTLYTMEREAICCPLIPKKFNPLFSSKKIYFITKYFKEVHELEKPIVQFYFEPNTRSKYDHALLKKLAAVQKSYEPNCSFDLRAFYFANSPYIQSDSKKFETYVQQKSYIIWIPGHLMIPLYWDQVFNGQSHKLCLQRYPSNSSPLRKRRVDYD